MEEVRSTTNKFKAMRISKGLTQKDVAEALGISQVSVWQWESGDNFPRADKLPAIARLFECTVDDLIKEEPA